MKRTLFFITLIVFMLCAIVIAVLALGPLGLKSQNAQEQHRTRIIIPRETNSPALDSAAAERMAYEDSVTLKTALQDGEITVAVLNYEFDGDVAEEQVAAFRSLLETEGPIYITYIDYDERNRAYRRLWSAPTAATRPGTVSLYTQDLIGDRNACILLSGMNSTGEHTLTVFRRNAQAEAGVPFVKIAELCIDGSITVQETGRSQAYQQGIANGQPYTIAAYGHDYQSENILDQVEITYAFNPVNGLYEQSKMTRIPGSQIEQRRLRELLSGTPGIFENFINDLWYYVSPQGTLDKSQYIYFDPVNREIIFFGDETQQVFVWQNSNPTRYGLYISSQNISVTTLRRFMDIELESLNSIRLRVFEDVRLKITVSASWDGSYRRAGTSPKKTDQTRQDFTSYFDGVYDSSMGRLHFFKNGVYELSSGGLVKKGRYVFFQAGAQNLLELRPEPEKGVYPKNGRNSGLARLIYRIEAAGTGSAEDGETGNFETFTISRVRLGAMGIQDLHEGQIILSSVR
jgi:hypothetical protein